MKRAVVFLLALILVISISGVCFAASGSPKNVKIAAFANLTGGNAADGEYFQRAINIMVDRINNEGGIKSMGGAKLEIVYHDTMTDATMIKTVMEQGLADPDVAFAMGALGTTYTLAGIPAISKAGVPIFTSAMSDSLDNQNCEYLFLVADYASALTKMTVDYIKFLGKEYGLNTQKIGVTFIDNEYSRSVADNFQKLIQNEPDLKCVFYQPYPPTVSDMSSIVTALKAADAQILFLVPSTQDAKLFAQTMKAMNYRPVVLGGSGTSTPVFGDEMGDDVRGILIMAQAAFCQGNAMANPEWKWIFDQYAAKYPGFSGEVTTYHIAWMTIIKEVLEATGTIDRETNLKAIREMEFTVPQPTAGNKLKFNEKNRNKFASNIVSQWQYVEEYDRNIPVCVYPVEYAYAELQFSK